MENAGCVHVLQAISQLLGHGIGEELVQGTMCTQMLAEAFPRDVRQRDPGGWGTIAVSQER